MKYVQPKGDWVKLPKRWSDLRPGLRDDVAATAGEIHTCDNGVLMLIDGQWEVLESGDLSEADVVRNALRRPS